MKTINAHGQITIPKQFRKMIGYFPGMKCNIRYSYNEKGILITPYNYKCTECGTRIPEGTESNFCMDCQLKKSIHVY